MALSVWPDLYLLRHGQTEWNVQSRLQGRLDSPLTALGIAQARRQAEMVADLPNDLACFSSTAGRALQTAHIALAGRDFRKDERLLEIDVGDFTGEREADLRAAHPAIFYGHPLAWYDLSPGGEDFAALKARVLDFLSELSGPSVIVTHGITLRMIRQLAMGIPMERIADLPVMQGALHCIRGGAEQVLR
ncbi:histidine phosphatase family protein [Paracoccus sp. KR1-242]|uniref:histidine phosphatase family protein n=1 Tax=Paracoccus sp. KR1-242 TaxID=3410028 RepID=UPI003C0F32BC